MVISVDNSIA